MKFGLLALVFSSAVAASGGAALAQNVVTYHNDAIRSGLYVAPNLNWSTAANVHIDPGFNTKIVGNIYAQPLYWQPGGGKPNEIIVATESNKVYALNATTGKIIWQKQLGTAAQGSALTCGDINPIGITGAPAIDPATGIIYVDAIDHTSKGPNHKIYALSALKGVQQSGFPINVDTTLKKIHPSPVFSSLIQGHRSADAVINGQLFLTYSGNAGDCDTNTIDYHGWVVGVNLGKKPALFGAWATTAIKGGIWGQSGPAYDGTSMFVTTGNTVNATFWGGGESVVRLSMATLAQPTSTADYFTPSNWATLDQQDLDLGGTAAVPLNVPKNGGGGTVARIIALGKDGNAYLLDRNNLGGLGGQLFLTKVSSSMIRTAAASFTSGNAVMVSFQGTGSNCPVNQTNGNLTVLSVIDDPTTPITTAWCGAFNGVSAPIVTTTDGTSNPIVWVVGAEGDNELHGFKGTDGTPLYTSASMSGLHHFQTFISANNRFYVTANGKVYAFCYLSANTCPAT